MSDASLDATAETLARRLLQALPAHQPVARTAFDRLPAPVARVLHAQLDARVDREATLPVTPWLDRDHKAVRDAQAAWREAARTAAHVPADAWEDMLANASRRAIAHLVEPAETLAATAFDNELTRDDDLTTPDPLPTPLVLDRLRAFSPYVIEIVERYIDKKGLGHIDRHGLERLLERIYSRMVSEFSPADWGTHLDPLFNLLGGTVPTRLLQDAFEARDHRQLVADLDGETTTREALLAHLATELGTETTAPFVEATPDPDLAAVEPESESTPEPATDAEPASEPEAAEDATPVSEPEAVVRLAPEPMHPEPTPPPPVIGSKFNAPEEVAPDDSDVLGPARPVEIMAPMEPMVSLTTPSDAITEAVVTETMEETTATGDEPLWKRLAGSAEAPPPPPPAAAEVTPLWAQFSHEESTSTVASATPGATAPLPLRLDVSLDALELAVLGASDPDRRSWYTEELFSGNAADYHATLLHLDAARTWTEATDIIARDVFRKHSVSIYSDPSVMFTDAVQATMETR